MLSSECVLHRSLPKPLRHLTHSLHPCCPSSRPSTGLESNPGCSDADGDGVCDVEDNCPSGFNPDQEPAAFGQAIVAERKDRFSWPVPADVVFVIGDLTAVDTLAVTDSGTLLDETSIFDPVVPSPGFGAFYLVRLGGDCSMASWQTTVGVEPERDLFLP